MKLDKTLPVSSVSIVVKGYEIYIGDALFHYYYLLRLTGLLKAAYHRVQHAIAAGFITS